MEDYSLMRLDSKAESLKSQSPTKINFTFIGSRVIKLSLGGSGNIKAHKRWNCCFAFNVIMCRIE